MDDTAGVQGGLTEEAKRDNVIRLAFVGRSAGYEKFCRVLMHTILPGTNADAYRAKHPDKPGLTMPTRDPHVRLDYVFVPRRFVDRVISCDVVNHADAVQASDHFPVVADLHVE